MKANNQVNPDFLHDDLKKLKLKLCCKSEILHKIAYNCAMLDFKHFQDVGKPVKKRSAYSICQTYFNRSATNCSLACFLYTSYFDSRMLTKSQVSYALEISRNAASEKIDHCFQAGYVKKFGTKYVATPLFIEAYVNGIEQWCKEYGAKVTQTGNFIDVFLDSTNDK
jgi:hypothetical protein